jgi:surface antigen
MRRAAFIALCAGSLLAITTGTAGAQSNLSFLKNSPLAYFNADDTKLMRAVASELLESSRDGTRKDWENPATGNGGSITLLQSFSAPDGRRCARVSLENHAKGMQNTSTMTVCKTPDGPWRADDVKPPKQ